MRRRFVSTTTPTTGRTPAIGPCRAAVIAVAVALSAACSARPTLLCQYETRDSCELAASAVLDVAPGRADIESVTVRPPDGTWRRDGATYLALAMVHYADGAVRLYQVTQRSGEPMRADELRQGVDQ